MAQEGESNMTFLEIEAFLKIAQCGSFSAAAEKLYITQPALGRRIRALEEELGYSLFIRNKGVRHVELTRQGRAFVGIAHRWQALWNETQEEALLSNEKSFYVASVGSLLAFMLPTVFQEFIRNTPECSLHVTTLHSSEAYSYVNNKTVDIAAGIYFFFRDGRRYWWQMGRQNGWPTPYRKYVYLNPGFILYVIIFGIEMISYIL